MAISGRKPTPVVLKLIAGNPGRRPLPKQRSEPVPGGAIERPDKLKGNPGKLWDRYIARCHWLTWADGPKALMWCHLQAEYEKAPGKMSASRIAQLRAVASEIGFDQAARTRMGITVNTGGKSKSTPDPAHRYFT